jgi:hypothetical protein
MTDAEGQLLFRFAGDLSQENAALRAELDWLRAEMREIAEIMRLCARDLQRAAQAPSPPP